MLTGRIVENEPNYNGGIIMWLVLGFIAIVATIINLSMFATGKDYKLAMAMALSFTALTLCAVHSLISKWVEGNDWGALLDVVPSMEKILWILTIVSILLNISPIFLQRVISHFRKYN